MPALIAAPWLGTAIAGVATGTGAIVGAKMQSSAATKGAQMQADAANRAAEIQAQTSRETERFQREQAQHDWETQEATRRANYDQWVARERRLGSIAERLGYGAREIPAYVPSVNPGFDGSRPRPIAPAPPPAVPSARDVIMARRYPTGSIGAYLQGRPRPAGV